MSKQLAKGERDGSGNIYGGDLRERLSTELESAAQGNESSRAIAVKEFRQSGLNVAGIKLTPKGLSIKDAMNIDQFEQVGEVLFLLNNGIQWCIGDWVVYGDSYKYNSTYQQLAAKFGYEVESLHNIASICRNIDFSSRNEKLTFSHHRVVASIASEKQVELLAYAEKNKLSVKEFRDYVFPPKPAVPPIAEFLNAIYKLQTEVTYEEWFDLPPQERQAGWESITQIFNIVDSWENPDRTPEKSPIKKR